MTDDEIDAAIRAVVPAECFRTNAGARAIYRAGFEAGRIAATNAAERSFENLARLLPSNPAID